MNKSRRLKDIAFFGVILLLVIVALYSGLQILESTTFNNGQNTGESVASKTITRDGIDYFPRQDITVMMVLGIDQEGPVVATDSHKNHGAADVVMLAIFDETNQVYNVLQLNRDTMLEMPVLGIGGRQAGTYYGQLALSHTYGSGLADSCENTHKAISDFLYGITIDHYVSMNMDAIAILNDAVGGVTVTVTEDFSAVDDTIPVGEVTLHGQQALNFVRLRKGVGDQLNLSRMNRQREYMDSFVTAFRDAQDSSTEFVISTYDAVSPYIVTDCSATVFSSMMERYGDYEMGEIVSPEGENVRGEEYYEFYVDEAKLDELILRLFYAPKE